MILDSYLIINYFGRLGGGVVFRISEKNDQINTSFCEIAGCVKILKPNIVTKVTSDLRSLGLSILFIKTIISIVAHLEKNVPPNLIMVQCSVWVLDGSCI